MGRNSMVTCFWMPRGLEWFGPRRVELRSRRILRDGGLLKKIGAYRCRPRCKCVVKYWYRWSMTCEWCYHRVAFHRTLAVSKALVITALTARCGLFQGKKKEKGKPVRGTHLSREQHSRTQSAGLKKRKRSVQHTCMSATSTPAAWP